MANPVSVFLVVAIVGGFGAVLVGGGLWVLFKQHWQIMTYTSTSGEIVRADVGPVDPPWYAPSSVDARRAGTENKYGDEPQIEYEYQVDGESYTNETLWPSDMAPMTKRLTKQNQNFAGSVVAPYESGDEITVHYDPDEPENAFLFDERDLLRPVLFVVFGLIPISWLVTTL